MSVSDRYAGLVIDLDGVIFRGDEVVRGASGFLKRARRAGQAMVFVTNNSARTAEDWAEALDRQRVRIEPSQVLTSASATASLLAGSGARCFVIGEAGLLSALREGGLEVVDEAAEAEVVVVGWDTHLTYDKLRAAAGAISRGARFVGTNPDRVIPASDGAWPGTGSTLAFLRAATGVAPEIVGKPMTPLFELAGERLAVDGPVLVVGDQVATDVSAAAKMGWDSALVLSGVARWASVIAADDPPTWVVGSVADLDGPEPPVVRHARESDLTAIRGLLEHAGFDVTGAARRLRDTLVAEDPEGAVVGTVSWEMVGPAAHLRGITVAARERGHGTGSHLVVRALHELNAAGVDWVYLLTPGADEMFEKLGFYQVQRDRVPEEILATAQFGAPAAGATALVRRLRDDSAGRMS